MSLFSVNTNLGAMAALQSLSQTASAMKETQNEISTGQKVSQASDNPAVYAISQAMNATISGLSAVQDGLTFGAQVVGTASTAAASISSTLASLQHTLTTGQQQGLSQSQMNQSISAALSQIDTYANSATMNGVNLVAGSTGNGVTSTQLQVLTSAAGSAFTVGGTGAQALNATSAGLGLSGLSVTSNDVQISLGADSSSGAATGMTLIADGKGVVGATGGAEVATGGLALDGTGSGTVNTNIQFQTTNYGATDGTQTAQNPGSLTVAMLSDNSLTAKQDVMNELNALVTNATTGTAGTVGTVGTPGTVSGIADYKTGTGSNFTFDNNNNIVLTAGQKGGSITDLGNGSTQYSFVIASDANGNPTQTINVIAANVGALATTAGSSTKLASELDGSNAMGVVGPPAGTNNASNMATRQSALGTLVSAMNASGLSASIDTNNNLTISGNNINTIGSATPYSANAKSATVNNIATASGSGLFLTTAAGAKGTQAVGGGSLYGVQQANASAAISNVTAAITKLGTMSSALGTATDQITGMQSFTSSLSSALTAGVGALTDADMASESAKLTSLQTKQQLGISALSIANQQPQALLKLFG